jgi:hypothetical protein
MSDRVASLSTPALVALLGGACLVVLAGAFAVGRATAPSGRHAAPALVSVSGSGAQLSLPQLSQAVPVPALAATPRPPAPATAPKQVVHRTKPKRAGAPVDITGSG